MKTVLAWSGGKDSTASAILARLNDIAIDEIVLALPDPFQLELEFIPKFERFMGQKVIVAPGITFEEFFFTRKGSRAKYPGTLYGWPFLAYKACARMMKWQPMQRCFKDKQVRFILGLAKDEKRPLLAPNRSLLIEYDYTEQMAKDLCNEYGLLNPLYKYFDRLGCVRCPKQRKAALWKVRELEPAKFQWMLDNDHLSPIKFKQHKTFREFMGL